MTVPYSEIYKLDPGARVELLKLDAGVAGGSIYRFHAGTNQLGGEVVWQGNTFSKMPVIAEGFERTSKGAPARPTLRVANVDGMIGLLVRDSDDLCGCSVTRQIVLAKHLDAVNFPGGVNPTADPTLVVQEDLYYIESKKAETGEFIEFELVSPMDTGGGCKVPARIMQATICGWNDASICSYSVNGLCANGLSAGVKAKTLDACKAHWGATADLPFGGFPGCGIVR